MKMSLRFLSLGLIQTKFFVEKKSTERDRLFCRKRDCMDDTDSSREISRDIHKDIRLDLDLG